MEIEFPHIPDSIKRIKLDVGLSYGAPQSEKWLSHDDDLFVIGFEPNTENINEIMSDGDIQKRHPAHGDGLTREHKKRFHLYPFALGNVKTPSTIDFYEMERDSGTSSMYRPIDPSIGGVKKITKVPLYSLSHVLEKFPWDRFPYIEYLKTDAQGADLNVLIGAGDYIKNVVYVTAEAENHQYEGCGYNNGRNLMEWMSQHGFQRIYHANTDNNEYNLTFVNTRYLSKDSGVNVNDIFIWQKG